MSAMFARIRPSGRRSLAIALLAIGLPFQALAQETLVVTLDQARMIRLPERTSTIVIGNPLIADASLQAGGMIVLTGKSYGATNFVALDRSGAVLMERTLRVEGPREHEVIVYCKANPGQLIIEAIAVVFKDMRAKLGIEMKP